MLEMETMDFKVCQNSKGATTLVVDFAKSFEKVQVSVVWRRLSILIFRKECLLYHVATSLMHAG